MTPEEQSNLDRTRALLVRRQLEDDELAAELRATGLTAFVDTSEWWIRRRDPLAFLLWEIREARKAGFRPSTLRPAAPVVNPPPRLNLGTSRSVPKARTAAPVRKSTKGITIQPAGMSLARAFEIADVAEANKIAKPFEHDADIIRMHGEHATDNAIATALGIPHSRVEARRGELNLPRNSTRKFATTEGNHR